MPAVPARETHARCRRGIADLDAPWSLFECNAVSEGTTLSGRWWTIRDRRGGARRSPPVRGGRGENPLVFLQGSPTCRALDQTAFRKGQGFGPGHDEMVEDLYVHQREG